VTREKQAITFTGDFQKGKPVFRRLRAMSGAPAAMEILTSAERRPISDPHWHSSKESANNFAYGLRRAASSARRAEKEDIAMAFRPLHDRIVVKRIEGEEKTKGGIIIPDTAKEKPQEGKVVSVGPGARDESGKLVPLDVKAGDRVLFGKWSGTEVKIDGDDLLIMKESDILGIVE
jgi:chaperonin GroES